MGCLFTHKNILLHVLLTLKLYIMSHSNCYCEEDYICHPCYNKELEEEYQAMQEFMNIEIADDAEELPF